jgi:aminopeptidase N
MNYSIVKKSSLVLLLLSFSLLAFTQTDFTKADTLRGSLNENRDWFDILSYDITVTPDINNKSIAGTVVWNAKAIKNNQLIQIDLQQPLVIDSILFTPLDKMQWQKITFKREGNIALAKPDLPIGINAGFGLLIFYHGQPREAIRPPWDGGWIWKKDSNGKPWVSVACQGLGASVWYPCKDHQSDEPDFGAAINIQTPDNIIGIANGKPGQTRIKNEYRWIVRNPINNYNIIPYIGDYVGWKENYKGLKGDLSVQYYALRTDSAKAAEQFKQVPKMLEAFEYWFGPYPFYEDGFKLVQSPHLGMEHQSAIAYGNQFKNGYLGRDLSGTGWGLNWDFIIVHESGHEWFANNITTKDIADMWVHEGFTNYSETLFTEYYYGKEAANQYNFGIRKNIQNDRPIIGHYGVNEEGSGDMYYKASNMIHSIRHAIHNDSLFRQILIGMNKQFYHQTVTTQEIENYISIQSGTNFNKVFDQYLRTTQIPQFVYQYDANEKVLTYQWKNCVAGFNLPLHFKYLGTQYDFMPLDFQPQMRLIKDPNFNLKEFVKTIQQLYYVELKEEF